VQELETGLSERQQGTSQHVTQHITQHTQAAVYKVELLETPYSLDTAAAPTITAVTPAAAPAGTAAAAGEATTLQV
jgi:hypothetical protein